MSHYPACEEKLTKVNAFRSAFCYPFNPPTVFFAGVFQPGGSDPLRYSGKEWRKMDTGINGLANLGFISWIWVFLLFTAIHELEEWNINAFERRHFTDVPEYATSRSARGVIVFVCLAGLIWSSAAAVSGDPTTAAWILLPAVFFMIMNAVQHVYWSVLSRSFMPGIFSAVFLIIPSGAYMILRAVGPEKVPAWYAAVWTVIFTAVWIHTARAGRRMTLFIRGVYRIGYWISERIPGAE
jgi:hypothetical protein